MNQDKTLTIRCSERQKELIKSTAKQLNMPVGKALEIIISYFNNTKDLEFILTDLDNTKKGKNILADLISPK